MNIAIRLLLVAAASWNLGLAQDRPEAVAGEVFVIVTPEALPHTPPHCSWQPGKTGAVAPTGVWQSLSPYAEAMGLADAERYFDRGPAAQDPLLSRVWKLRFDPAIPLPQMRKLLQAQPWVDTTEVNTLYYHQSTFSPNEFNQQLAFLTLYWVDMVRARQAWFRHRPAQATVVIGVVDDGVRITHEDLRNNIWTNDGEVPGNGIDDDGNGYVDDYRGYDVADRDSNVIPPSGMNHGTHVAGIAAATTHNSVGVVSMAYNAQIMAVKATADAGAGILGIDGVRYAAENGAHIINMSWGAAQTNIVLNSYINMAIANYGTLFVGGAGNDGKQQNFFPAAHVPVVAVGSVDFNFKVSSFSNYGTFVDIMAPGNPIYSCGNNSNNHYLSLSGTSMATPMVSSALALMKSYYPEATNAQLLDCLLLNARDVEADNDVKYAGKVGSGCVDIDAALECLDFTFNPASRQAGQLPPDLRLYPTPATDHLTLQCPAAWLGQPLHWQVVDLPGRPVLTGRTTAAHTQRLPVAALPAGAYSLQVQTGQNTYHLRWVKQ